MNEPDNSRLDDCGCCEVEQPRPALDNPPGRRALAYRLGTHSSFLERMLNRLYRQTIPDGPNKGRQPLTALTTRRPDDPTLALIDAWAVVADVLTFYQERIANEGFLRTATERHSVLELARAIGYELSPGVAAATLLAFTLEEATSAPRLVKIPRGTRVQSLPGQGQMPQSFETVQEIEARVEWNALRPRLTQPQQLDADVELLYLQGIALNLKLGDLLLIVTDTGTISPKLTTKVAVETKAGRTRVEFVPSPSALDYDYDPNPDAEIPANPVPFTPENVVTYILEKTWCDRDLNTFLSANRWDAQDLLAQVATLANVLPQGKVYAFRTRLSCFGHNAPRWDTLPAVNESQLTALKTEIVDGGSSLKPVDNGDEKDSKADPYPKSWDKNGGRTIWTDSQGNPPEGRTRIYLERSVPEVVRGGWAILETDEQLDETSQGTAQTIGLSKFRQQPAPPGPDQPIAIQEQKPYRQVYQIDAVAETSLADYGLVGKVTGLDLLDERGNGISSGKLAFKVRRTTVYVQSERLQLTHLPIETPLNAGASQLMLERIVLGLRVGQAVLLSGQESDSGGGETGTRRQEFLTVREILHLKAYTVLCFNEGLRYSYIRSTATLNANVVEATHGETVQEVLGSGDGSQANQHFTLKRSPLTYVSSPTASGAESTLEVRANNLLWQGAPSLYGLDGRSESYIIRIDGENRATVTFGDGIVGARLPSGRENLTATYRVGIGPEGNVPADSLTLLANRPLGVRGVTNPLPARGGAAPETLENARSNAPLIVRTLERIVSLTDFEDFARAFAGVGKAQAVAVWNGAARLAHITVAADNGDEIPLHLHDNLVRAIDAARDPSLCYQVASNPSYQRLYFNLKANLFIDEPRYRPEIVIAQVAEALKTAFSFERRSFGQSVSAAEVLAAIQRVPGIIAADLDRFYRADLSPPSSDLPIAVLPAAIAHWDEASQTIKPAELLLLNPAGLTLWKMNP